MSSPSVLASAGAGLAIGGLVNWVLYRPAVRRIPDTVFLPAYVVCALMQMPAGAAAGDWSAPWRALLGAVALTVMVFGLALALPHLVGFRDAKLAGLLGLNLAWLDWNTELAAILGCLLLTLCTGAVQPPTDRRRRRTLAFGPMVTGGAMLAILLAVPIAKWHGSLPLV